MRKFTLVLLLLVLLLCSCKKKEDKKLIINYYDQNVLITSIEYKNSINSLEEYSKDGYKFINWYLDESFNTQFDFNNIDYYFSIETINLYAKLEKEMKELEITINGYINDNEVVLNPIFSWTNPNNETSFNLTIWEDEFIKDTVDLSETSYQVKLPLEGDTEYKIVIKEKNTKNKTTLNFKTVSSSDIKVDGISLVNPFSDNMVIQRGVSNVIRGKAPANYQLFLTIGEEKLSTFSDNNGNFEFTLKEKDASFDPVDIIIEDGIDPIKKISNVLFGDVYLFSGQSNMQWSLGSSDYLDSDITNLTNSNIRYFSQTVSTSETKLESVKGGHWLIPTKLNARELSAIATLTASMLESDLKDETPIGIITAYQGNTNIADWMGEEYYYGKCSTKNIHYNAMVYPLRHANIKGVVWYQGCNNSAAGCEYKDYLTAFFKNYRDLFRNENLPFFVIGLACYDGDEGNNFDFSFVRESQALACMEDRNSYFISICDDGDPTYIHPKAKRYVALRVTKSIESVLYNKDYYSEGPSYKSHTVDGSIVTIELNNSIGLYNKGDIKGLYLAGEDGKYFEANVSIVDNKLVASTSKVSNPVYIKYGFSKSPFVNIFNKDDFAIAPFRTDNYNTNIDLFDYSSTDSYYFHPDGSKMEVSIKNNNLVIKKLSDGKGYGSIRLDKWGSIAYEPEGFEFTIIGNNSGASIAFRVIEGESFEIWGYKIVDNFVGERTFKVGVGDFTVLYNKQNNIFEPQKTTYIELMIECSGSASIELKEARFVKMDRTSPIGFIISNVTESDDSINVTLSKSLFSNSYELVLTDSDINNVLYKEENETGIFSIDKTNLLKNVPYYLYATSKNELGTKDANNNGYVFYLKDDDRVIICNFDFKDQASLESYIESAMDVHSGLTSSLDEKGVKITSAGKGWQQFIFKLDTGVARSMKKLEFYADFTNYSGEVVLQLADTNWKIYEYVLNISTTKKGTFTIDFSNFINKPDTPFTTQSLMWVMFNFSDTAGGDIILDNVNLIK